VGSRRVGALVAVAATLVAGCGDEDFENEPRPPVPIGMSGVINGSEVNVSPSRVGAGPVVITVSNQTQRPRTITLEGESLVAEEGPIAPGDTATIQRTLSPGSYEVRAGSETAVRKEIAPAVIDIGPERPASNNDLMLP
jgi:hypothetical protein